MLSRGETSAVSGLKWTREVIHSKMKAMKTASWAILMLVPAMIGKAGGLDQITEQPSRYSGGAVSVASLHCMRFPRRLVGGYSVDLRPLCTWWSNAWTFAAEHPERSTSDGPAARPLKAWVRIIGEPTQGTTEGWTVAGFIETAPHASAPATIYLKHPPTKDAQRFVDLRGTWTALNQIRENMYAASQANAARVNEQGAKAGMMRAVANAAPSFPGFAASADEYSRAAAMAGQRMRAQGLTSIQAGMRLDDVNKGLKAFPYGETYLVDFFAMPTGEVRAGLPVYDMGMMVDDR